VFRQNAKVVPMASDTRTDPRRVNGVTAYFVGESTAATLSDKQWDRVRLTAKKLMVLTKYSNELNEDAVLNIGDDLAGKIAYAFALKEDQCGFLGDGTSGYGSIRGVINALLAVDPTGAGNPANIMGLVISSGTGFASNYNGIALSDFNRLVANLPEYADVPGQAKFYCSKFFWGAVMQKLATAAGGNRVADLQDTPLRKSFLGYDVVISQVMPKISAINQICCLFGNLALGARLGDRRQTTIQMSEHALNAFEQDEVVIRGTERFDIVVHDVGDPTPSAGPAKSAQVGNVAGPIVGLITAGS
jgi:HK97 family phage major capsid protein